MQRVRVDTYSLSLVPGFDVAEEVVRTGGQLKFKVEAEQAVEASVDDVTRPEPHRNTTSVGLAE